MKWVLRILGAVVGLIVLAVLALYLAGFRRGHGRNSVTVEIARPPAQVFRYLTDDELVKRWVGGLVEIKHLNADVPGVGARMHMVEEYKGESVPMDMEITGFEANRAIKFRIISAGDPSEGFTEAGEYVLEPTGTGTRLTLSATSEYQGFLPRLFEPLITPEAQKKLKEDLARLKGLVEGEPPQH
ncbi:MAG: SRPBCC family protein [Candidatus Acidiferrales bacterium]